MRNKLLTDSLQEAMMILKTTGYEEDVSYRFIRLEEDFSQRETRVYKTAGGYSIHYVEDKALEDYYETSPEIRAP